MESGKQQVMLGKVLRLGNEKHSKDRRLADSVYEQILAMISSGETPVGGRLPTENALSRQLKVSRPVLRQALKQLREDGVIVSRQGSGSYVQRRPEDAVRDFAPVGSIADIQRTFEFRAAIESEAAYLAAERRSADEMRKLILILNDLDRSIVVEELGVELDEAFHETICEASGNHYFTTARVSMKTNILTGLNLTRNLSLTKPRTRMELVQEEHYDILRAIEAQDRDAARHAMRVHVENARKRVFEGQ